MLVLYIKKLTMDWKTIKAFGVCIKLVIKKKNLAWFRYFLGTRYFRGGGGVVTFGGSLFSGFISSHKVLTLL